jgi:hypothetical protein
MLCAIALLGMFLTRVLAQPTEPVSPVVYPPQDTPLIFSHPLHIGQVGAQCEDCHDKVRESASALDNNLPRESQCKSCHDIDRSDPARRDEPGKPPGSCAACHSGYDPQTGFVPRKNLAIPNLKFSHRGHLARNTPCSQCHGREISGGAAAAGIGTMPTMRACLSCHDGKQAEDACTTCHISETGGVVKTEFVGLGTLVPSGAIRGAAHDMNFRQSHKFAAQNDQQFCSSCHKKEFCVDCHNGVTKPMDFHAGDYVRMHAIDARRNSPDCSSCHRVQTFCQGCHSRMGVSADNKGSEFNPGSGFRFHPPGWVGSGLAGDQGAASHAFEAQRNIKQCASCHRESFCTKCHSSQPGNTMRINPHPRDWRGSRRCEALLKRNKRMCLRCHVEAAPLSCL